MLSKNKIKFINSIKKKKYRDLHECFFVEGEKMIDELLNSGHKTISLLATNDWIIKNQSKIYNKNIEEIIEVSPEELSKISSLSTANRVFAVVKKIDYSYNTNEISKNLSILLDNINDPGNLGTIIRIADWFGIKDIFCTKESVDLYNPKVVQSTMGAIFRIKVHYVDFDKLFKEVEPFEDFKIYGTFLEGKNIYQEKLSSNGFIIMGSESHGISDKWKPFVNSKLFIPNYPENSENSETSESLNISVATAIVCSEFRRRV